MGRDADAELPDGTPGSIRKLVAGLAALPGVVSVALGGSRSQGTDQPDSDWDFGVYYRTGFDPSDVRVLGYPGTVVGIGAWGGGVFNGGAWLRVDNRKVDLMWRDLSYAADAHARHGRVTAYFGLLGVGAAEFAHSVAATSGRWVTNDKALLTIGRMDGVDEIVRNAGLNPTPDQLLAAVDATIHLGRQGVAAVG
jgi:hypothetical protein